MKKEPQLIFSEVWERIKKKTKIKTQVQLGELIGITQSGVSQKKRENEFPISWAYVIAVECRLSLDWLITGKEPICPIEPIGPIQAESIKEPAHSFILLINEWFEEMRQDEPGREEWFRYNFEDAFPSFKNWMQRKNAANQRGRLVEAVA